MQKVAFGCLIRAMVTQFRVLGFSVFGELVSALGLQVAKAGCDFAEARKEVEWLFEVEGGG